MTFCPPGAGIAPNVVHDDVRFLILKPTITEIQTREWMFAMNP